mmetsp:Transcript_84178/g.140581  ORF Transcript_84178/g.140581 Transcript_84178/m.140581 type:complete len:312 (+) Transcript_84178:55-990(+)
MAIINGKLTFYDEHLGWDAQQAIVPRAPDCRADAPTGVIATSVYYTPQVVQQALKATGAATLDEQLDLLLSSEPRVPSRNSQSKRDRRENPLFASTYQRHFPLKGSPRAASAPKAADNRVPGAQPYGIYGDLGRPVSLYQQEYTEKSPGLQYKGPQQAFWDLPAAACARAKGRPSSSTSASSAKAPGLRPPKPPRTPRSRGSQVSQLVGAAAAAHAVIPHPPPGPAAAPFPPAAVTAVADAPATKSFGSQQPSFAAKRGPKKHISNASERLRRFRSQFYAARGIALPDIEEQPEPPSGECEDSPNLMVADV